MRHLIFLLLVSALGIYCVNSSKNNRPKYDFKGQTTFCDDDFGKDCFTSPEDLGIYNAARAENMFLSKFEIDVKTEKEISQKFHQQSSYKYINDERLTRLRKIMDKMRPYIQRKDIEYTVHLIEDEVINAWTIPGGNIYVTTGIVKFAKNDDEIANILGHEIGHNECKHTQKQLKRERAANALNPFGFNVSPLVNLAGYALMSFGQHEELESDRTGFYLSYNAGYDPLVGLDFWKRLAQEETQNRVMKLFRSHPFSSDRFECGKSFLEAHRVN